MQKQNAHITESLTENYPSVDFGYFALWKDARPYISEIRTYLANRFEVLLETEIIWSEKHFRQNAARLYEVPIYGKLTDETIPVDHTHKIGNTKFIVFVVKDHNPIHNYHSSVSGTIEICNMNIVSAKDVFRNWVASSSETKYAVHSSNNFEEFSFQIPLLLGLATFKMLVSGKTLNTPFFKKDLEGAGGWETAEAMFAVLNCSTNYLVLRNFESLPAISTLKDLDFLTAKYQRLASAMGVTQNPEKPYKGKVSIGNTILPVDIRFVGDDYYCSTWAAKMLKERVFKNSLYVPATDHYFFSLLYHAAVQKPTVSDSYKDSISELAHSLQFGWFLDTMLENEQQLATVLRGYMLAKGYYYTTPIDTKVYKNQKVIRVLPKQSSFVVKKSLKIKIKHALLLIILKRWYFYYLQFRTGKVHDARK